MLHQQLLLVIIIMSDTNGKLRFLSSPLSKNNVMFPGKKMKHTWSWNPIAQKNSETSHPTLYPKCYTFLLDVNRKHWSFLLTPPWNPFPHFIDKGCCTPKAVLKLSYVVCWSHRNFFCLLCLFLYRSSECEMKIKVWYIYLKNTPLFYMLFKVEWVLSTWSQTLLNTCSGDQESLHLSFTSLSLSFFMYNMKYPKFTVLGISFILFISAKPFIIFKNKAQNRDMTDI